LEEQAFVNERVYQTKMENKVKHNIPPMMAVNTKIQQADKVHVMQTSESRIKHKCQPILLPKKQIWNRFSPKKINTIEFRK
jgi:hypothetical protein